MMIVNIQNGIVKVTVLFFLNTELKDFSAGGGPQ